MQSACVVGEFELETLSWREGSLGGSKRRLPPGRGFNFQNTPPKLRAYLTQPPEAESGGVLYKTQPQDWYCTLPSCYHQQVRDHWFGLANQPSRDFWMPKPEQGARERARNMDPPTHSLAPARQRIPLAPLSPSPGVSVTGRTCHSYSTHVLRRWF